MQTVPTGRTPAAERATRSAPGPRLGVVCSRSADDRRGYCPSDATLRATTYLLALMLELDLIGRHVVVSDSDARLLLTAAETDSGSSIGSRDLATRLKGLADPATSTRRRRLVFTRPESRALQRIIQKQLEPTDELHDLRTTLCDLLAPD